MKSPSSSAVISAMRWVFSGIVLLTMLAGCSSSTDLSSDWTAPQHPFMAQNGRSNLHNDAYMTDTYSWAGPTNDRLNILATNLNRLCASITFDQKGRLVTLGIGADSGRALYLLDPTTLTTLATYELPPGTGTGFSSGGYFYLDQLNRAVVPTTTKHILVIGISENPLAFYLDADYDLTSLPDPCQLESAIPDWSGRLWFVTEEGIVGIVKPGLPPKTTTLKHKVGDIDVPEGIFNSLAVDETGGVFIASDYALYRFDADALGNPVITWREPYDHGIRKKPGQNSWGSGTTPTLLGTDYVAITDNADPRMNVLVFKRKRDVAGPRLVCKVPVFEDGKSATENSLIGIGHSLIVENNYGYSDPIDFVGKLSEPGIARVDFGDSGSKVVWTSNERAPSVVPKYSSVTNLIYTYTKDVDGWYFVGINFNTGQSAFRYKVSGDDRPHNNHYSGIVLHPDGMAYAGIMLGVLRLAP